MALRRSTSSLMTSGRWAIPSCTAASAAIPSETTTSILCACFSFAIRQPRDVSTAIAREPLRRRLHLIGIKTDLLHAELPAQVPQRVLDLPLEVQRVGGRRLED